MELARSLAGFHPLLIHFPIALILLGVACDLLALARRRERLAWAGQWLTLLGTAALLLAFICGILAETFAARAGSPQDPIEAHERYATAAAWIFIALASWRLLLGAAPARRALAAYLFFAFTGCGLLIMTAHLGGRVVYEYGANVAGALPLHGPSADDLATVAQHQTQASLTYSNQMHHIFGWLVLCLAAGILCERLRLGALEKLRRLMPLIFIGGGLYLFIYSDWDSWPLSTMRPVTDAEVMLHKSIALIMMGVGGAALLRRRAVGETRRHWAWQNKLIAAMALAGAGALFTHVHTNAPYTTNAIGVYLNHAALGLTALWVAAAVLTEDAWPARRAVALLFPAALLCESLLLLRYDENLPWFLGYHSIAAEAPHGGVLAQLPAGRAELVFTPERGDLDVFFYQSRSAASRPIAAALLTGELQAASQRVPLQFTAAPGQRGGYDHFRASAPWLRGVPLFTLRLNVPAARGAGHWQAEFDPWVTAPLLPPLIGASQVFACPMCYDALSSRPGKCPICGMTLDTIPPSELRPVSFWSNELSRPRRPLHDANFQMQFKTAPAAPLAGRPTALEFRLVDSATSKTLTQFQTIHTKLLHLIIVSKDLSWFDHVHPELQPDGRFLLTETFPSGGEYFLYPDLSPAGANAQIFRLPCAVQGAAPVPVLLQPDNALTRTFQGVQVSLVLTPTPPRAGSETQLTFILSKEGHPLDDLGLFLGAAGHCIIIHEDTQTFVHTHPMPLTAAPVPPAGPSVSFHALLPRKGLYKAWGQFMHRGEVITADFTFRVQ